MRVFRIAQKQYARDLSGHGAELYGGRWTPPGYPVLYAAEHPALAGFEKLVHAGIRAIGSPLGHRLVVIDLPPGEVERISHVPADPVAIGIAWLESGEKPYLQVPSIVVPYSANILINPQHSVTAEMSISDEAAFIFDPRLEAPS